MYTLKSILLLLLQIYSFLLIIRIILSWLSHDSYHPLILQLKKITDPYLDLFRSLPLNFSGLDLSPIVAFFVLSLLEKLIIQIF
ncbi:MAG: hypothetical protein A2Y40_10470 [Candidatus Margulisbacteria bacterium GWF2_35_9]|nr:MAG: hypothetical protein A2Y40_10470 [Candidatus Margulisbacteria bacterium GWF2_35_9]